MPTRSFRLIAAVAAACCGAPRAATPAALLQKLAAGRIDSFPSSVQEIRGERENHRSEGFAIVPKLASHYPTAVYFFVDKRRPELAGDNRKGLVIALRDRSFQALFECNCDALLKRSSLDRRCIFGMKNPLLPAAPPLGDERLWYHPAPRPTR